MTGFIQHFAFNVFMQALPTLIILSICVAIIVFFVSKPKLFKKKKKGYQTIDDQYNEERKEQQLELDEILEKIHKKGLHSLSKREKEILTRHSDKKEN